MDRSSYNPNYNIFIGNETGRSILRSAGKSNPITIDDYLNQGGYQALKKALWNTSPGDVINEVIQSGLRGRGGAGFPTGLKWRTCAGVDNPPRYIICNGNEGDPQAFADKYIMESDPHSVLEGMIIAAYAIGAVRGFIYVRDQYTRAAASLTRALDDARRQGFLGSNILDSSLSFDIILIRGGNAFICGEETALIAAIEGKISEPGDKYILPVEKGLWGQPTVVNNVETWANIPIIIDYGSESFALTGARGSPGTKVFSLTGNVVNPGLVEVPLSTSLHTIIFDIGGGIPGAKFKAVQVGGPVGGYIPGSMLNLKVDYDCLRGAGTIMGSGGIKVMDDHTCMVGSARYAMNFLAN